MKENEYQRKVIEKLESTFPDCLVLKNDPTYIQGIADLTVLYNNKFALLEVKRSAHENVQPNQEYYLNLAMSNGAFACFLYPENEEEVMNGLKEYFS